MLTYSTRLSYLPANRQGGTRTRDPVIPCAFGALRKSATSCKQLALTLLPEACQLHECHKKNFHNTIKTKEKKHYPPFGTPIFTASKQR